MRLDILLADLVRDECISGKIPLKPYLCPAKKMTIGIGRNLDDNGISEAEAYYMAQNDIAEAIRVCRRIFTTWDSMTDARQEAFANMAFNLGETRLRKFKLMIAAAERGDWVSVSNNVLASKYAYQVGDRAKRIAAALLAG